MILTFVEVLPKIYLSIAILFSTFFVLQSVLTLFGNLDNLSSDADSDLDFDEDFDIDEDFDVDEDFEIDEDSGMRLSDASTPFHLFSLRAILGFFILFSWTGYISLLNDVNPYVSIIYALIAGIIAMFAVSYLVFLLYKLANDGTMNIDLAVGQEGTVYLHIPGRNNGTGKVQIVVGESLRTLDAISTDSEIKSGKKVIVKFTVIK